MPRTSYPTELIVSVDDVKAQVNLIDFTADDSLIEKYIRAATAYAEAYSQRTFLNSTYSLYLDCWTPGKLYLSYPPLVSCQSIQYLDANGATQTWSATEYVCCINSAKGFIWSTSAPPHKSQPQSVWVNYTAGYGATADLVPLQAKQAVAMLAAYYYEVREAASEIKKESVAFSVHALLDQIAIVEVF